MAVTQKLQRFGNHLIVGISGTTLNDDDKRILNELKPVGVIFFQKNFRYDAPYEVWLQSFSELIDQIKQYSDRDSMFLTLDHEGGRVHRTPPPLTRFPHALLYKSKSREIAAATGVELKSLGINVSWSPVADIFPIPTTQLLDLALLEKLRKWLLKVLLITTLVCKTQELLDVPNISQVMATPALILT